MHKRSGVTGLFCSVQSESRIPAGNVEFTKLGRPCLSSIRSRGCRQSRISQSFCSKPQVGDGLKQSVKLHLVWGGFFVYVCGTYIVRHLNGTELRCAPSTCVVHHRPVFLHQQPALCTTALCCAPPTCVLQGYYAQKWK